MLILKKLLKLVFEKRNLDFFSWDLLELGIILMKFKWLMRFMISDSRRNVIIHSGSRGFGCTSCNGALVQIEREMKRDVTEKKDR